MLERYIPNRVSQTLLKHFIIVSLFFPYFISKSESVYYPDYILSVFFALLIAFCMFQWKDLKFRREAMTAFVLIGILFIYDLTASYMNLKYLKWYSDEINVTISFGFFIVLLLSSKTDKQVITDKMIRFLIHSIIVSNILAMILFIKKYYCALFMNGRVQLVPMDPSYYEVRFYWIYHHKCEYAFMLVAFIALFFVYRKLFKNVITFGMSVAFLFGCIVASHTFTSMIAAMFIIAGFCMDILIKNRDKFKKRYILYVLPVVGVLGMVMLKMLKERNIGNLGKRIPIWKASIAYLKTHIYGMGRNFGIEWIDIPELGEGAKRTNCHNLFLNQILRFSLPVGICFILLVVVIIVASILRRKSFLIVGIWVALLIPMNMDYCLMTNSLPMLLLILYCIGFREYGQSRGLNDGLFESTKGIKSS